ncbi:MAG TPA: thermonuclease family protein [Brevundimonas sp.]|nr:thermonuclease family protein [Brevundimonas sp.]
MRLALLLSLAALVAVGCRPLDAGAPVIEAGAESEPASATGNFRVGALRVIDGDTFVMEGETVRIANIDAPEMSPRSKCLAEANLAEVAKSQLDGLLGASWAGTGSGVLPVIERDGEDQYGRTLARVVAVDGKDVGDEMVASGAAVRWTGKQAEWCAV